MAGQQGTDYGRVIHLPLADGDHWFELSVARKTVSGDEGPRFIVLSHDITPRRRAQLALEASEERYRLLAENIHDVIWTMDLNQRFTYFGPSVEKYRGYTAEEATRQSMEEILTPESYALAMAKIAESMAIVRATGRWPDASAELEHICKDGSTMWGEVTTSGIYSPAGQLTGILGVTRDITLRRRAQLALQASEERYRLLAENSQDVIWTMDFTGRFTYISPSVKKLRGYTAEEAMQQSLQEMLTPESYAIVEASMADGAAKVQASGRFPEGRGEFEQTCKDGSTVWVEIATTGMYNPGGQFIGILGVSRDITERRKTQERIAHMAHHDPLTGLPNRALLSDRLDRVLAKAEREKKPFALLFIDLDRFKPINDIHGHAIGDLLLHEVAARMKSSLRASDTAARVGGDEFVILLPDVAGESDALRVAEKIRHVLTEPFEIEGKRLTISMSSGLVLYPDHGHHEQELFTHADLAMYRAKALGRNNIQVYRANMA